MKPTAYLSKSILEPWNPLVGFGRRGVGGGLLSEGIIVFYQRVGVGVAVGIPIEVGPAACVIGWVLSLVEIVLSFLSLLLLLIGL